MNLRLFIGNISKNMIYSGIACTLNENGGCATIENVIIGVNALAKRECWSKFGSVPTSTEIRQIAHDQFQILKYKMLNGQTGWIVTFKA